MEGEVMGTWVSGILEELIWEWAVWGLGDGEEGPSSQPHQSLHTHHVPDPSPTSGSTLSSGLCEEPQ